MKRPIHLEPHLSPEQIRERLYRSKNGHRASYWQIILSVSLNPDKPAQDYCATLWEFLPPSFTAWFPYTTKRARSFARP
jgi:hypothetical protein